MRAAEETERSVVVKGRSVRDALHKAAFLLHARPDEVSYEVLQEGTVGRTGLGGTPYKLRVFVGGPPPPEPHPGENAATADVDAPVPPALMIADLGEEDLAALSSDAFLQLLARVEQNVFAANAPGSSDGDDGSAPAPGEAAAVQDGEVTVEVTPSRMEAFVAATFPLGGGRAVTTADVHAALAAAGVRYGIDEAAVALVVRGTGGGGASASRWDCLLRLVWTPRSGTSRTRAR